jgi:hypothetical protein
MFMVVSLNGRGNEKVEYEMIASLHRTLGHMLTTAYKPLQTIKTPMHEVGWP